nr:UbiA family prenyltransferase [Litoribacter ruber]
MYFFADVAGVALGMIYYLLLALAVWSIYTLDHLMDAQSMESLPSSPRHRFHRENFHSLRIALIVVAIAGLAIAWQIFRISSFSLAGLGLGGLILFNMFLMKFSLQKFAVFKEFNISIFYIMGIMLVPILFYREDPLHKAFWLFGLAYLFVALLNLWILSWVELESDKRDGFASIATVLGRKKLTFLIAVWMGVGLVFILSLYWLLLSFYYIHISILLIMFLIQALQFFQYFDKGKVARQVMEASFMLPFLLIVF